MSQRNSGYERKQNEAYFTPDWATYCLLEVLRCTDGIDNFYDPACGDGQIVKACRRFGLKADGSDIHYYGYSDNIVDFLEMEKLPEGYNNIITNPPYGERGKLAEKFIEHAIQLVSKTNGIAAFLLRSDFDAAKGRRNIFGRNPWFNGQVSLLKRIQWTNLIHTASSSQNHAWFIWNTEKVQPIIKFYAHPDDFKKTMAELGVFEGAK